MAERAPERVPALEVPEDHFTRELGFWVSYDHRGAVARTTLRPSMWGVGSRRTRLAVFASIADALGGQAPEPSRFPSIDLRAHLVAEPPSTGPIELVGRPLRLGRRFVVAEIEMHDEQGSVFGRATVTLLNNFFDGGSPAAAFEPPGRTPSLDRLLAARAVDEQRLELDLTDQIANRQAGTPFGGVQALFAELAAEHLVGEPLAATDVDIRFLQPLKIGPMRAIATRVGPGGPLNGLDAYRVDLVDAGASDALLSAVTLLARPLERSERAE